MRPTIVCPMVVRLVVVRLVVVRLVVMTVRLVTLCPRIVRLMSARAIVIRVPVVADGMLMRRVGVLVRFVHGRGGCIKRGRLTGNDVADAG